jgi:hypothetical protein
MVETVDTDPPNGSFKALVRDWAGVSRVNPAGRAVLRKAGAGNEPSSRYTGARVTTRQFAVSTGTLDVAVDATLEMSRQHESLLTAAVHNRTDAF